MEDKKIEERRIEFDKKLKEEIDKILKELHEPYQDTFGEIIIKIANNRTVSIEKKLTIEKHQKIDLTKNPYKIEIIKD